MEKGTPKGILFLLKRDIVPMYDRPKTRTRSAEMQ